MNTITHEGKTYEVLTLDRISEITHAKLASGVIIDAKPQIDDDPENDIVYLNYEDGTTDDVWAASLEKLSIQPLRLVPKEPVTFEATFGRKGIGYWYPLHSLDDGLAYQGSEQKRFRCVEIVEEA